MKKSRLIRGCFACMFILISLSTSAATINVGAFDGGWYRSDGLHNPPNENYLAGEAGAIEHRNWFAFDLSSVTLREGEFIINATLSLQNGRYGGGMSETWTVVSVETNVSDVTAAHSSGSVAGIGVFNDLKDGGFYGETTVNSSTGISTIIDVSFIGVNAIMDITASIGGLFAVGGYVSSLDSSSDEFLFSGSKDQLASVTLSLETTVVPVPAAFWLFGSGILGLIGVAALRVHTYLGSH